MSVATGKRPASCRLAAGLTNPSGLGAGGKFFEIQTETIGFSAASNANGSPLLARPFYETWPSASSGVGPASFLVTGQTSVGTLPFTLTGDIQAVTQTDVMGAEGYLRYLLYCAPGRRLDLIGGYQFSRVDDRLQINNSTDYQPQIFGAHFEAEDLFDTQNKFHGGELGLLGEFGRGPVTLSVLAKVGLGNMNEVVTIAGQSALTDAGGFTSYYNGGILALPTNIGTYKQDKFALIPEAEIKLNFKLTRHLGSHRRLRLHLLEHPGLGGRTNRHVVGQPADGQFQPVVWRLPGSGWEARIPRSAESRIRACGCRACRWA